MSAADHYFAASPSAPNAQRTITVDLGARKGEVVVSNGVFSPSRLDPGTAVLLREIPFPTTGALAPDHAINLLDLGSGWGPIALSLALAAPTARVWAVDVNERALALTQLNAERLGLANVTAALPDDVPDDVRFSEIWSNPPIRVGKAELHRILLKWLSRLEPDGTAWLVVQKNLGADSLATWLRTDAGYEVTKVASSKGYRVLRVRVESSD